MVGLWPFGYWKYGTESGRGNKAGNVRVICLNPGVEVSAVSETYKIV